MIEDPSLNTRREAAYLWTGGSKVVKVSFPILPLLCQPFRQSQHGGKQKSRCFCSQTLLLLLSFLIPPEGPLPSLGFQRTAPRGTQRHPESSLKARRGLES